MKRKERYIICVYSIIESFLDKTERKVDDPEGPKYSNKP